MYKVFTPFMQACDLLEMFRLKKIIFSSLE